MGKRTPGMRGYDGLDAAIERTYSGVKLETVGKLRDMNGKLIRAGDAMQAMALSEVEVLELYSDVSMVRVRVPDGDVSWFECVGPVLGDGDG